jgi:hypothetical protein
MYCRGCLFGGRVGGGQFLGQFVHPGLEGIYLVFQVDYPFDAREVDAFLLGQALYFPEDRDVSH